MHSAGNRDVITAKQKKTVPGSRRELPIDSLPFRRRIRAVQGVLQLNDLPVLFPYLALIFHVILYLNAEREKKSCISTC